MYEGKKDFPRTSQLLKEWTTGNKPLLPGVAVLVQHRGEVRFEQAAGFARFSPAVSATTENIWSVASISKPVSAVAIMQLVEAGDISLDQPVVELLPEFGPGKERVLLRHLLTHSSGIPDNWPELAITQQKGMVEAIGAMDLLFEPGTACSYCSPGFDLFGAIIQRCSGLDFVEYTESCILKPLGMRESSFRPPSAWHERIPTVYDPQGGDKVWPNDPRFVELGSPAAGLFSTLRDLAAFGQAFLNGGEGLISQDTHRQMLTLHTPGLRDMEGNPQSWGLGWYLNRDNRPRRTAEGLSQSAYMHGGATSTWLAVDPEHELVLVQLANRFGAEQEATQQKQDSLVEAVLQDLSAVP